MKKRIIISLWCVLASCGTQAQLVYTPGDTLEGRCNYYYYNPLDELCPWFHQYSYATYHASGHEDDAFTKLVRIEHTDRQMAVKGIAAMVTRIEDYLADNSWIYFNSPSPGKKAEYVYLCSDDSLRLTMIDSARWDTLTPRLLKLPKSPDTLTDSNTDNFLYCHLFEAYFEESHLVDSRFLMAGSYYSNSDANPKTYIPTKYFVVAEDYDICNEGCHGDTTGYLYSYLDSEYLQRLIDEAYAYYDSLGELDRYKDSIDYAISLIWRSRLDRAKTGHLGPFFAIVDFYQLDATVADSCTGMGWALGSGRYPDRSLDTIMARPRPGYCFVQWDDGNTDNPRIVDLTQDTLFTAIFGTCPAEGIPSPTESSLPFSVQPNPTTGTVAVGTPSDGSYQLTLYDMAGRLLMQTSFTGTATTLDLSHMAAGSYQLMLRSATVSGIKVIVKQ
ncbi:MAG: T9SS type A sorting domain-containing protein [Bacteroidales bacterium]|nr:T9SS type A sorting domain-containing protein [Bacteroidales bacterium]